MQINELAGRGVPETVIDGILAKGIDELNPPQRQAVQNGLLDGKSMIISAPTASGKTLIATLGIGKALQQGSKALYLVPLKALASEKYQDYQDLFEDTDYSVRMSVGDRDSSGEQLADSDLVIMTVEKLDAILRHNPSWIKDVEMVVEDEIHLLNSEDRGPTLEVTLTRLREMIEFQLLGLSATIKNADELADWLDATLVDSEYRPVDLEEGIHWQDSIEYYLNTGDISLTHQEQDTPSFTTAAQRQNDEAIEDTLETRTDHISDRKSRPTLNILNDTFKQEKQAITFVRSRKSAESEAEKAGDLTSEFLSREEQQQLEDLADDIKNVLGSPTEQCKRLARCVKDGTAFHHAGLLSQQRSMIEEAFRDDLIKTISATPTLAAGVSLPAYRIIIRDVKRYTNSGLSFIPVLEYRQMAGRAGRPEHHDKGEAIAVAKNQGMKEEIRDRYILGEQENIYSKLAVEPVLRMHALSLIATRFVTDMDGLESFFAKTFYAHQYGDMSDISEKLQDVVANLIEYGFIEEHDGDVGPTRLGKRVAELYIDPYSANHMMETLEETVEEGKDRSSLPLLVMICQTVEMRPLLRVRKDESIDLEDILQNVREDLFTDVPEPWGHEYDSFLESFKTALMLEGWISEKDEDEMMDEFNVTPGGIRAKVENADWLLYACEEITDINEWDDARSDIRKLRTRVQHGIEEELVRLVKFKGIGRVRARALYDSGIETASDIRDVGFTRLKKLIGKKTAKKLKEQVGQDNVFDRENVLDYMQD